MMGTEEILPQMPPLPLPSVAAGKASLLLSVHLSLGGGQAGANAGLDFILCF